MSHDDLGDLSSVYVSKNDKISDLVNQPYLQTKRSTSIAQIMFVTLLFLVIGLGVWAFIDNRKEMDNLKIKIETSDSKLDKFSASTPSKANLKALELQLKHINSNLVEKNQIRIKENQLLISSIEKKINMIINQKKDMVKEIEETKYFFKLQNEKQEQVEKKLVEFALQQSKIENKSNEQNKNILEILRDLKTANQDYAAFEKQRIRDNKRILQIETTVRKLLNPEGNKLETQIVH